MNWNLWQSVHHASVVKDSAQREFSVLPKRLTGKSVSNMTYLVSSEMLYQLHKAAQ